MNKDQAINSFGILTIHEPKMICPVCYNAISIPSSIEVRYLGKSEDKISGEIRDHFLFRHPIRCLCGELIKAIFVDCQNFRDIQIQQY